MREAVINSFCEEMKKFVQIVLLFVVACHLGADGELANTGEGGLMSGDGGPGDIDTMIDDEDFATTAADAPFRVWAHTSEPCNNWFENGKNMETVKNVFRSTLTKAIQGQCNCKIDIRNDNLSCEGGVLQFTGNITTDGMSDIDESAIIGGWARNPNSKRIKISTITTLTIAESRTAAINIGNATPAGDINNLTTPASVNVGGVDSAAVNTGVHVCVLITAAMLNVAQFL